MRATTINVPVSSLTSGITIAFRLTGASRWRVRLWIAARLVRVAGFIAGCRVEVDIVPREK